MEVAKVLLLLAIYAVAATYSQGLVVGTYVASPNAPIVIGPLVNPDITFTLLTSTFVYLGNYSMTLTALVQTEDCSSKTWFRPTCDIHVDLVELMGTATPQGSGVNAQTTDLASLLISFDSVTSCVQTTNFGLALCAWGLATGGGSYTFGYRRMVDTDPTSAVVSMFLSEEVTALGPTASGMAAASVFKPFFSAFPLNYYKS